MIKKLSDAQAAVFDKLYIADALRASWNEALAERFDASEPFRVVDVGGGNGALADQMIDAFPKCRVTIVDNSQLLLDRNRPHDRKQTVLASADEIDRHIEDGSVDLMCFHSVLHHFVSGGHSATTSMVRDILRIATRKLAPGGRVSVFENMYDGYVFDDLPGRIILPLVASRRLAGLTSRMGANTAGVGVCFRSRKAWTRLFESCGYQLIAYNEGPAWPNSLAKRFALHLRSARNSHFWLAASNNAATPAAA